MCGSCDGGTISGTWQYWVESGLVSGGDYNSNEVRKTFRNALST